MCESVYQDKDIRKINNPYIKMQMKLIQTDHSAHFNAPITFVLRLLRSFFPPPVLLRDVSPKSFYVKRNLHCRPGK